MVVICNEEVVGWCLSGDGYYVVGGVVEFEIVVVDEEVLSVVI